MTMELWQFSLEKVNKFLFCKELVTGQKFSSTVFKSMKLRGEWYRSRNDQLILLKLTLLNLSQKIFLK